jgi:hypothetical protein
VRRRTTHVSHTFADLQTDNVEDLFRLPEVEVKSETAEGKSDGGEEVKVDSGIESMSSHSDKVCVDCGKFWEPPKAEVGSTYLTLNHKTKKWIKAELVEATPEGSFHLVASRHSQTFIVGAEYLVHPEPPPCLLRVGSRALAILNRTAETGEITRGRGAYQLGVVAEHPTAANRFRWRHRPKLVNTTLVF